MDSPKPLAVSENLATVQPNEGEIICLNQNVNHIVMAKKIIPMVCFRIANVKLR